MEILYVCDIMTPANNETLVKILKELRELKKLLKELKQ